MTLSTQLMEYRNVFRKKIDALSKDNDKSSFVLKLVDHLYQSDLFKIISFRFKNPHLLVNSLCHNSFSNEFKKFKFENNEKLEFVGDSVLSLLITEELYQKYEKLSEGELSKFRASLVNEDILCALSRSIRLERVILTGAGDEKSGTFLNSGPLSDAFESLLGAIYLDSGMEAARKSLFEIIFHYQNVTGNLYFDFDRVLYFDAKGTLQEETMRLYKSGPRYESVENKHGFETSLYIEGLLVGKYQSKSKKKGQREVAYEVLKNKKYMPENLKGEPTYVI